MPQLTRITRDPAVMGGKPCIPGMRVTAWHSRWARRRRTFPQRDSSRDP